MFPGVNKTITYDICLACLHRSIIYYAQLLPCLATCDMVLDCIVCVYDQGSIVYEQVLPGSAYFDVDPSTGAITLQSSLRFDSRLQITVRAQG